MPVKDYLVHAHMGNCILKDKEIPAMATSILGSVLKAGKMMLRN
jgi:hypothetical protein